MTESMTTCNRAPDGLSDVLGPSGAPGSAVRCSRCGTESPAGTTNCEQCGCFLPSNEANLKHGLRRYQATGVLPVEIAAHVARFRDQLISDQGGEAELSAIRAGLVDKLTQLEARCCLLEVEVIRRGIDSRPGAKAHEQHLATLDRWFRFASSLGPGRRTRRLNVAEEMAAIHEREEVGT